MQISLQGVRKPAQPSKTLVGGGGSNSSSSSNRVAMGPSVGRHAPGAKARRKASGTQVRKGVMVCDTWVGNEKKNLKFKI